MAKLNSEQLQAMSSTASNNLVLAGPGTGKTTTLVARLRNLISSGVSPKQILCITFNKKAADEISKRVKKATGIDSKSFQIGTFHALANRIIRKDLAKVTPVEPEYDIWARDYERQTKVKELVNIALKKGYYGGKIISKDIEISEVLRFIDDARDTLTDPENSMIVAEESGNPFAEGHALVYEKFVEFLKENNRVDFPRMIQLAVAALETQGPEARQFIQSFTHILIDEYQDINLSQKIMIDFLIHEETNLWVVGDDDQAIYGWRGSDASFLLNFEKNYPGTKKFFLSTNYRSGDMIIRASSRLASNLSQRFPKKFSGDRGIKGTVRFKYSEDEAKEKEYLLSIILKLLRQDNDFKDIAVLARTNDLPNPLASKLVGLGIPVILKGGVGAFSGYEVQLMLSALAISSQIKPEKLWRLKVGSDLYGFSKKIEDENWDKKVKSITTFIANRLSDKKTDEELLAIVSEMDEAKAILLKSPDAKTFFSTLKKSLQEPEDGNAVFLGTIHSAKGLEWKNVLLMGFEEELLPHFKSFTPKQVEEERRLTYVAITRTKDQLVLSASKKRKDNTSELSRFFWELGLSKKDSIDKERSYTYDEVKTSVSKSREWTPPTDPAWERLLGRLLSRGDYKADQTIATGEGETVSGWSDQAAGTGLLAVCGYTVRKDGPIKEERQGILRNVFNGNVIVPNWISDSVKSQWSAPNSADRLQKIRNTLNIALGNQKGRKNPSNQAIEKWESDIEFLDQVLSQEIIKS